MKVGGAVGIYEMIVGENLSTAFAIAVRATACRNVVRDQINGGGGVFCLFKEMCQVLIWVVLRRPY